MLTSEGLHLRAALFRSVRSFFHKQGFIEVDTPVRQPVLIPESSIEPFGSGSWYLQASPELCMKRILATGERRIFQLSQCFRKRELGRKHLEEFTMVEWYRADDDYVQLMEDCRNLIQKVIHDLEERKRFRPILEKSCFLQMDIGQQWQKTSVAEAFASFCPISVTEALEQDLFDEMIVEFVEPQLGRECPHFLYDYPVQCGSLARKKDSDPAIVERFEMYVSGLELANGFSELTDVHEQRQRFEMEIARIKDTFGYSAQMPERFLEDLNLIDRAAGVALGLDRLLMLIMSAHSIGDVVPFSADDW